MMLPSKLRDLRDLRKKHGLSQKELAEKLMTTQAKVASWENGDSVPDISYIAKLTVLYDVSADYLLKDGKQEGQTIMDRQNTKRLGRINSIYWTIVIAVYLLASIATGRWSTSWVLFILGGAIWLIGAGFHWINSTK
ncbi:helix-turn-helix domain-containing protein [Lactobacillus delbrueckii]|uniref:helix-turn-helix domain-containing protein n=1 Tax=Lactobacillus delbrueckii TaxID=1584 RepID=UPI0006822525|nr:helix-turn-helix transcriptional regulator [Lactobacillus delbrueckii]APG75231.1 transcriptional regulator [Lactobacillus delbrueckii subsp. sunkii]KNE73693.1 DNA-binding protein [Lactobacillus delbrueckii subsp. sunkii]GHN13544.1 XRE family transcriptional regulator [Lactobacillus delbrueckii subsp. sunkii]GHN15012.1 XRE family transcriptional regulator [Lactobacillus delbrueckii subsp. sunkii]